MIDWIAIRHFAITERVELELDTGFSAITGETGSGKSLMVGALTILLGARADSGLIRQGEVQAEIQCSFSLKKDHPVFAWLLQQELPADGELILRRIIRRDKPGRGYINGAAVNISTLRELGAGLVDIHGQHEHHSLMHRAVQQKLLDHVAGNDTLLQEIGDCHTLWRTLSGELARIESESNDIQQRIDLLTFQLSELDALAAKPGEWNELSSLQKRFAHRAEISTACATALSALYDSSEDTVHDSLSRHAAGLRQLEKHDDALGRIAAIIEEAAVNVGEAGRQLRDSLQESDSDPAKVAEVEQRFAAYYELSRKHRIQPVDLVDYTEKLRIELTSLQNPDAERQRLEIAIADQFAIYLKLSKKLTRLRTRAAKELSIEITAAMRELGMEGGEFDVALQPIAKQIVSASGSESVEFMVNTNPGQPLKPIAKVASGGELSRISLAIQVILAGAASVPTLVFDEVDVGIGGTVANIVGEKLRHLGQKCQVLCITHLPQVAARANQHFSVRKSNIGDNSIRIEIKKLDSDERVAEIARMSGSEKLTSQAKAHAEQMLAGA